ncbi:MAG: leucyl aminopeptidase [Bacteroidales bacterium]|nr:leucyl aminopeptidase [Bacteroidales bacterium]
MNLDIKICESFSKNDNIVILTDKIEKLNKYGLEKLELDFINNLHDRKENLIQINQYKRIIYVKFIPEKEFKYSLFEELRKSASKLKSDLNKLKIEKITIIDTDNNFERLISFSEGLALSHYQFIKYFEDKAEKINSLKEINVYTEKKYLNQIEDLKISVESVYKARDLVNEPLSFLNTNQFAEEIKKLSVESGFLLNVLDKKQIESLKMGGLLAVNKGSNLPPKFAILTWEPENAKNNNFIVLVGKGIVYDTGGLSLKSTANSMDIMKSDMGGAAAVASILYAIAKMKLDVKVIGLIPITDNSINNEAYVPGDVIKMHNGKTVEVLNTDAEGRLILADALSYAEKYKPELVIDFATLTGAAVMAIGEYGIVSMGNADDVTFNKLETSGTDVYERIVRFPLWDEYKELLKSDIADVKNIGGKVAGAITAGKFLEIFTNYNWIHLDIAGPAFISNDDHYRTKGGTGVSVRLIINFLKKQYFA